MAKNTIKVKNYSDIMEEITATAVAIRPGVFLELTSAGTVQAVSTAGGNIIPMVACEDELQGKGIGDSYAASDKIQVWIPGRGDQVYAWLEDGQSVAIGAFLECTTTGTLQAHAADISDAPNVTNQIVAVALEAVDLTASANLTADGRIIVRIV